MNVHDHLKVLTVPEIKTYYKLNTIPAACAMMHVTGDFNLSTLISNSNFFGYEEIYYVGGSKQYDRQSTVGTHNYVDVKFINTEEEFVEMVRNSNYKLIAIENNVDHPSNNFFEFFKLMPNINEFGTPMFIFGEEQHGLSDYMLYNSDHILFIPGNGPGRSLNVVAASGIVLSYYAQFFANK